MSSNHDARPAGFPAISHDRCWPVCLAVVLAMAAAVNASAEIVFQDFFTQPAGNVTNSVPWLDVEGNGWQPDGTASQLALDGSGHLYNGATNAAAAAGVQLVPIGPFGSVSASALVQLPAGSGESVDIGFAGSNLFLTTPTSGSGPWIQVFGTGGVNLYGGSGVNNMSSGGPGAYTNDGSPVGIFLIYDVYRNTASAGTIRGGVTNLIFNQRAVTNTLHAITPKYLVLQLSTNLTTATARWASAVTVDWLPRPPPLLALPGGIQQTNFVGAPGTNDIQLVQNAFNLAANATKATEIRFTAGATYVLTNGSLTGGFPLLLQRATNLLVNGNGCKILITNPRIGLLTVNFSSNVIVQGFSVDYDPLPFTQGVITHNYYTSNDVPKETAIEFLADAGYPAPTNANYIDTNAVINARRWGMVMDPARPGRLADGTYPSYFYTNVVQTNLNGAFKVYFPYSYQMATLQPGALWCMISRWNPSITFQAYESAQVTFLNDTIYTTAGPAYVGLHSPLVNEVNDQIGFGPPPAGATAVRRRSSNADGGLFIESRIGPWVQGCNFTGLGDDVANACVFPFVVTNAPAYPTNTLAVFQNTTSGGIPAGLISFQARPGDVIAFFNPANGSVFDRATVTAAALPYLTLDHAITNLVTGTFDTNTLLINETLNTAAVYLDNHFSNTEFNGIYCRANDMLIAHNTVSGIAGNAINGFPLMTTVFLNFFEPTNAVIMDNVLDDCGHTYDALRDAMPAGQPGYALIAIHSANLSSYYVTNSFEISGIRILYNAFLNWRRAPLALRNVTDTRVIGNYFGPPLTNDGLVPLAGDDLADLYASDYLNLRIADNVNASTLPDSRTINQDGTIGSIVNAFQPPAAPQLAVSVAGGNATVSWVSPAPGFVLQQTSRLMNGTNDWADAADSPELAGASNLVTLPIPAGGTNLFFRTRQR